MVTRAHAEISPSASHRWVHCPGSVNASRGRPDIASAFAAEGTAAHALAEHCLANGFDAEQFFGYVVDTRAIGSHRFQKTGDADGATRFDVDEEMVEGVQLYLDTMGEVADTCDEFEVEQRLDISHISPGMFGTGDAIGYDATRKRLTVGDLKYGRGVAVEPYENTQAVLYALGALQRYHNRGIAEVELIIVQPRCPHPAGPVRRWVAQPAKLLDMEADLIAAAKRVLDPDAPRVAGDWCKFCKAAPECPTLRARAREIATAEFTEAGDTVAIADPKRMTPDQLAAAMAEAETLETWCRSLREHAHGEALHGRGPTGWKLVAKRANRKWKDETAAQTALAGAGLDPFEFFAEPKMLSPAQVEKKLPKKTRDAVIAPLVAKESSGVVLAPESDPRPPVVPNAETEFADSAEPHVVQR